MKLIQNLPETADMVVEMAEISVDVEYLQKRIEEATMLPIDPAHDDMDDIIRQMETITGYLTAAKKGLGLTNSIKNPDQRTQHKSQVMSNMNRIRAKYKRIERMFDEWWENHRSGSERRSEPSNKPIDGESITGRRPDY